MARTAELIDGKFVAKPLSGGVEGNAKGGISTVLHPNFHSVAAGWWLGASVDTQLGENGYRPDLAGWRRTRSTAALKHRPVVLRPDWICELLSDAHRFGDTLLRLRQFHQAGVPHIWLRWRSAELPFDAIEIAVGALLGDDPE